MSKFTDTVERIKITIKTRDKVTRLMGIEQTPTSDSRDSLSSNIQSNILTNGVSYILLSEEVEQQKNFLPLEHSTSEITS